ncbi:MAG: serine protein kinase PrkA, partial [Deltaproteobacteria bacterium]|nr:serine protein kinase PrkA [Deltaproteobacteria bacterium]
MEASRILEQVGSAVSGTYAKGRTLLSFEEYLTLFLAEPRRQARTAAQYLRDAMDHFGTYEVPHPAGRIRRFRLFDGVEGPRSTVVAGQEEVQNAVYRLLGNFVRAGAVNKLVLLHGPNGSAKSSFVRALHEAMEAYSRLPEGALYRVNWIFPSEKLVKGSIGFGDGQKAAGPAGSYAHLEAEQVAVRLNCELKDHPLLLVPREERRALVEGALAEKAPGVVAGDALLDGEACHKCRRIFQPLLALHGGDWLKVMRHVQVERFEISRRYQVGAFTVEPQVSVDAGYHQVTADRSQQNLPASLQNVVLYEPHGPLVCANRGMLEYADLLKRPLETFKYLLGMSETGEVPLEHMVLQLDEVLIASSNEKHLGAFKELPDFASFKGRMELVRVPYLRHYRAEQAVYDAEVTPRTVGKHVAPHATRVAAAWAVLTRLKKPLSDRYPQQTRELVDGLLPLEKLHLYEEGEPPGRLGAGQARELKGIIPQLYEESDSYPHYEGRSGASAREIKTALFNAAQSSKHACLHPLAVLEELQGLCRDQTVYEFLQQEVVDGYHAHEAFVREVEAEYLDTVDGEVRESMGLVREAQYVELFDRYVQAVSHWVKGEKMRNRVTGEMEKPDEARMKELEEIFMPRGDDA